MPLIDLGAGVAFHRTQVIGVHDVEWDKQEPRVMPPHLGQVKMARRIGSGSSHGLQAPIVLVLCRYRKQDAGNGRTASTPNDPAQRGRDLFGVRDRQAAVSSPRGARED